MKNVNAREIEAEENRLIRREELREARAARKAEQRIERAKSTDMRPRGRRRK